MRALRMGTGKLALFGGLIFCGIAFTAGGSAAAANTQFKLNITSTVCVVDVVQDGGSQSLQPGEGCEPILPTLLTNIQKDTGEVPEFRLPFAGDSSPEPLIFRAGDEAAAEQRWAAFTSTDESAFTTQPGVRMATAVAGGVSAVAFAGIVAVDIVLFESHYSLRVGRWLRTLLTRS